MSPSRAAWVIFVKELVETLRDRKTLIIMVVVPMVLYPLIFIGLGQATQMQVEKLAAEELRVGVSGDLPDSLRAELEALEQTELVEVTDPEAAVKAGEVTAAVAVDAAARQAWESGTKGRAEVVFDGGSDRSRQAEQRVRKALDAYRDGLVDQRLSARGLDREVIEPVAVDAVNVAPPSRQGGYLLGQILPLLVSVLMIGATFYPAIDLTAGEKERGTLQTLLTAPIPPISIVGGKYLAVVALSLMNGLMNLLSMTLVAVNIPLPEEIAGDFSFDFGADVFLLILVCLLLLGMMFGAVMMAVAVTARSFKEAQNYLTPIYLVAIFPLLLAGLPGVSLNETTALFPIANLALAMKALLVGEATATPLLLTFASTIVFVALALVLSARVFRMEAVLLGDDGLRALFRRRTEAGPSRPPVPTVGEMVTLLGVVLLALFYGSVAMAGAPLLAIIHTTQWGLLLIPTVGLVLLLRLSPRETFKLRAPPAWGMAAGILAGLGLWVAIALALEWLARDWMPVPSPGMQHFEEQLRALGTDPVSAVALFAGIAIAPAICEEALFRGVVLTSLQRRLKTRTAIILQAVLFSLYHLNPWQIPATLVIGLLLGTLAARTRSIWPGVALHALHNGCTLALHLYLEPEALSSAPVLALLLGPVAAVALLAWRRREPPRNA